MTPREQEVNVGKQGDSTGGEAVIGRAGRVGR